MGKLEMKRSEIIGIITRYLYTNSKHVGDFLEIKKDANELLKLLEQAGMEPPSHMKPIPFENGIQYPLVPGDMKNDNGIWCTPGYFGWEPEDETK